MKHYDYAHEGINDGNFQRIKRPAHVRGATDSDGSAAARKKLGSARHPARKAGQGHRRAKRGDAQFG